MVNLIVQSLSKKFSNNLVVDNVSFNVLDKTFMTILGPSGCGKTTVLRCIAGVEQPDEGIIKIGNKTLFSKKNNVMIPTEKRGMGMVYQSYALWPHLTVFENIAYPLKIRNLSKSEIDEKVMDSLRLVRLNGLEDRLVPNLSGGQQQRVALARALVYNPKLLLLDEPLSNLDVILRDEMRTELKELQRKLKITTIYVTHDRTEALSLSDHIIIMDKGMIKASGTPDSLLNNPPNSYAGIILGDMSILKGKILDLDKSMATVNIQGNNLICQRIDQIEKGDDVKVLLKGSEVIIHNSERTGSNIFQAIIKTSAHTGQFVEYKILVKDQKIKVSRATTAYPLYKAGDNVFIEIPSSACSLVLE